MVTVVIVISNRQPHTHTDILPFYQPFFPGEPGLAGCQPVKNLTVAIPKTMETWANLE